MAFGLLNLVVNAAHADSGRLRQGMFAEVGIVGFPENIVVPNAAHQDDAHVVAVDKNAVIFGDWPFGLGCDKTKAAQFARRIGWRDIAATFVSGHRIEKLLHQFVGFGSKENIGVIVFVDGGRSSVIHKLDVPIDWTAIFENNRMIFNILCEDIRPLIHAKIIAGNLDGLSRLISRPDSSARNHSGEERISDYKTPGQPTPENYFVIMLCAIGLGGFITSVKGLYRESYIMVSGGWLIAAVTVTIGTTWIIIGHLPFFSERVSTGAGIDASATCYRRAENIRVLPIVIPELKFGDVEWHIFSTDFVECADNTALNHRPETIQRIGSQVGDNRPLKGVGLGYNHHCARWALGRNPVRETVLPAAPGRS